MKRFPFTYSAIRYARDPFAGECLNVGVVLYAPDARFLQAEFESSTTRLSHAFRDFDRWTYLHAIDSFRRELATIQGATSEVGLHARGFTDVADVIRQIWADPNLSLHAGDVRPGMSADPRNALSDLFDALVVSQGSEHVKRVRREKEDVWRRVETELPEVKRDFKAHTFRTEGFELKVEHTFRNGRLHVLEPLTFDYADKSGIFDVVTSWRGRLDLVANVSDQSQFYFVVGEPGNREFRDAARKGIKILEGSETRPKVIPEEEFQRFVPEFRTQVLQSRH
jgi:hypothetical protein